MTSRTPREPRLRLVPLPPAGHAVSNRRQKEGRRTARPPRGVAPQPRLARQARTLLSEAVRLARWADRTGTSPEADVAQAAAELGLTVGQVRDHWSRARLAGLVETGVEAGSDGSAATVRAGWRLRAWERDDSAVLRGWVALFDAWSLARPAPPDADPGLAADVVAAVPQLLSVMFLSDGPVTGAGLIDLLRQRITELRAERPAPGIAATGEGEPAAARVATLPRQGRRPAAEPGSTGSTAGTGSTGGGGEGGGAAVRAGAAADEAELVRLLGWALDALASVGALTLHARSRHPERARLTDLGGWAMWTKLEQICIAAQSPAGGNIEQSAVAMLRGCAGLTPGPARDEYRAWLAARPTAPAVTELLEAARGEDALIRGLAFEALRVVGAPALAAVRAVVDEPVLRPYALLWLADHQGMDPRDEAGSARGVLTRAEETWLWVDTASAAQEHGAEGVLLDHLDAAPQPSVTELVDEIRTCGHPRTVQVLLALASAHPDPAVTKRVRRAAFQVHAGGA
ncbi:hypothetical protein [Streptomyces hoynatensis]|uniref:Uncharacterized protein n=1 Tax=Streptomyces hoynatensis TaxID=1141874 RepID=A0A3A9Z209_9ACTN|nr:hypothetical protein [Streptomyces hoynatensis]RKN42451.1 hypothetical protein D7294_13670 [Streptomyces hoynatensis]